MPEVSVTTLLSWIILFLLRLDLVSQKRWVDMMRGENKASLKISLKTWFQGLNGIFFMIKVGHSSFLQNSSSYLSFCKINDRGILYSCVRVCLTLKKLFSAQKVPSCPYNVCGQWILMLQPSGLCSCFVCSSLLFCFLYNKLPIWCIN